MRVKAPERLLLALHFSESKQVARGVGPVDREIAQLASYIKSLKGSKPAGAKEPQGQEYKEASETATGAVKSEKSLVNNP